ncbi:MAG: bifunctional adenosylcobinamide kinase/adenosylcobinamide-phosphate guanylyltransferase [Deltaproteobacteria bacterium]|nr:MAG: bifunctional adenosylcobinamide kinase/adenosylcobinamide-phosphate guanylyltransferase [Deltaproteobacteria bacterium]
MTGTIWRNYEMAETTLIIGGCRSGKSEYALRLAENAGKRRLFIATAQVLDEEMRQRVDLHRKARRDRGWDTREENLNLADGLRRSEGYDVVLCDCLTLWVSNLQHEAFRNDIMLEEEEMARLAREVCAVGRSIPAQVIFVTNEVGMGIVPMNKISRWFRDLTGRCNQEMSAAVDSVIMVVSGLPIKLKG